MKKKNYLPQGGLSYYQDGGININPKHEGKFTEFARSIGMDVQAAAAHVLAHKDKYSPMRVKQANFARNAAGWKHEEGGPVFMPAPHGAFHFQLPSFLASHLPGMQNSYCPDCDGSLPMAQGGGSIVDYLGRQGVDPSYAHRKELYQQNFDEPYRGTAAQNIKMLQLVRQDNSKLSDQQPREVNQPREVFNQPNVTAPPTMAARPTSAENVHPTNGYINLQDYGINLYNKDGSYSPDAIKFAEQMQAANPATKMKFVCNEDGCFAIANRMSQGDTGKRLYGQAAWENTGKSIWQSPALQQYHVGSGEPLPNPADYSVPDVIKTLPRGLYLGLNRKNNQVGERATTIKDANDSYDYADKDLYPKSHGYEHMGYTLGNGRILHGTGASTNHPGFFVIDDLKDNDISLSGYGKYAPTEVLSVDPTAKAISPQYPSLMVKQGDKVQYQLKDNANDSEKQRESKNKLVSYFNDPNVDKQLMTTTGISYEDLQGLKPVLMGILGNESNFNDLSTGRKIKEFFGGFGSNPSVGPFQVKLNSIPENVRKQLGITSTDDLENLEKAYPAALSILYGNLKKTNEAVAKGKQPGLATMNPYWRAAYDYNMPMLTEAGDERIEQLWKEKTGGQGTAAEKKKFFEKMRLSGDVGSYPYKAWQNSGDLQPVSVSQQANNKAALKDRVAKDKSMFDPVAQLFTTPPTTLLQQPGPTLMQRAPILMQKQFGGGISEAGYKHTSPDRFNDFNIIPSNNITMRNVPHPVLGIDNTGMQQMMYPGANYRFPGQAVFEVPIRRFGGSLLYQQGGQAQFVAYDPTKRGYTPMGEQQGKKYYYKDAASSLPLATGTGSGGKDYEQFLINQLGAGVSPEELVQKKYISPSQLASYQPYYKPRRDIVYTQPAPVDNPANAFSGTYLFDPNQHAVAQVQYAARNSAGQADPGSLNTAQQMAQMMFMNDKGQVDTTRRYSIPADVFSNQMTGGTRTLRDTTGLSQYKVNAFQQGGQPQLVAYDPTKRGFTPMGEQQGKSYYYKDAASSLPLATGTGSGGKDYEQFLINQLGAGVSPEELVQKKYISPSQQASYQPYYKPRREVVYTQPAPVDNPANAFSGTYLFDPNQHAVAQVQYAARNSAGQADPGSLNTAQQMAQMMFMNDKGQVDTARRYSIPADVFSNQMTGGTRTLRDTTGISQYKVNAFQQGGAYGQKKMPKPANKAANFYQKGGLYNPFITRPDDPFSLALQAPNMTQFFQQQRIASKDNQNPLGINDPYATIPIPDTQAQGAAVDSVQNPAASNYTTQANQPYQRPPTPKKSFTWNPGLAGEFVTGLSFINKAIEANSGNRTKYLQQLRGMSDNFAPVMPGSRGDYSLNEGYFRPNQMVPVQFRGVPMAQDGGLFDNAITDVAALQAPSEVTQYAGMSTGYNAADAPDAPIPTPTPTPSTTRVTNAPRRDEAMVNVVGAKNVRINDKARAAFDYYVDQKDLSPHEAAGIVGNIWQESGFKENASEKGHTKAGRGLAQWDVNGRWKGFKDWADKNGRNASDLYAQLDYILEEPGESTKMLKALKRTDTPEQAAYIFGKVYERPLDKKDVAASQNPARWDIRAGVARKLYDEYTAANERNNQVAPKAGMYAGMPPVGGGAYAGMPPMGAGMNVGMPPVAGSYQTGGEYMVTPSQLQFILAHGGEVEFL